MADWTTVALSALSSVGFGSLSGVAIKAYADRRENERTWHRDLVIERYTAVRRALQSFHDAYLATVEPLMQQSPMPRLDSAAAAMTVANGRVIDAVSDALIVSRPRTTPVLFNCMGIDPSVLTPFSRPQGIPPIAIARQKAELAYVAEVLSKVLIAMRADLGLISKKNLTAADLHLQEFIERASISRSFFATVEPAAVVPNLRHYMVVPLALADSGFQMPTVHLNIYLHEWLPHLSAQLCATGVDAVLIRDETNIHACVRQEIEGYRQLIRLRQIGVTVESAFQHSPATVGWRDLPDGSSVWIWTAADHFGLGIDR